MTRSPFLLSSPFLPSPLQLPSLSSLPLPLALFPLFLPCVTRGHDEILAVLLSWCPDAAVNQAEDTMNATPVYAAAFDGYYKAVKLLIGRI